MSAIKEWKAVKLEILFQKDRVLELAEEASDLIKSQCGQIVSSFKLDFEIQGDPIRISDVYHKMPHQKMGMGMPVYPRHLPDVTDHWNFKLSTAKKLAEYLETINLGTFISIWENSQE